MLILEVNPLLLAMYGVEVEADLVVSICMLLLPGNPAKAARPTVKLIPLRLRGISALAGDVLRVLYLLAALTPFL
jgi:hypothetical protein